ncbi:hypothetical protein ACFYSC_31110 [Streptosporangium sp. NPDC004379]
MLLDGKRRRAYGVDTRTGKAHRLTDYPEKAALVLPGLASDAMTISG